MRGGGGDGDARGAWLDYEPTGEQLDVAERDLLPLGPGARKFKGEIVYTDLRLDEAA